MDVILSIVVNYFLQLFCTPCKRHQTAKIIMKKYLLIIKRIYRCHVSEQLIEKHQEIQAKISHICLESHLKDKNCRNDRLSVYNYRKIRTIIKEKIQDLLDTTSKYMSYATHFCPNSYNCMGNKTKTSNRWFLLRCLLLLFKMLKRKQNRSTVTFKMDIKFH